MADPTLQSLIDDPSIDAVDIKLTVKDEQEQLVHAALGRAEVEPEERVIFGGKFVCSAKVDSDQGRGEIEAVVAGEREMDNCSTASRKSWPVLRPLGPIEVRKWEYEPKELDHELTVEMWILPDGPDLVELSIKVAPDDAVASRAGLASYLSDRGFDVGGDQQTKTRAALSYFTGTEL